MTKMNDIFDDVSRAMSVAGDPGLPYRSQSAEVDYVSAPGGETCALCGDKAGFKTTCLKIKVRAGSYCVYYVYFHIECAGKIIMRAAH